MARNKKVPHEAYVDANIVLKYTPNAYTREDAEYLAEDEAKAYLAGLQDAGEIEEFEVIGVAAEPERDTEDNGERRDEIDELIQKEDADNDDYNN